MRSKQLLAAFLLGVGLCFVPVLGYGFMMSYEDTREIEIKLLDARLDYIMCKPATFLYVEC